MRRVPFKEPLWRPDPFLGSESREERGRQADFLAHRSESRSPSLAAVVMQHPELSHSYMAEVRRKILGLPKPEAVDIRPRLDRAIGEKR